MVSHYHIDHHFSKVGNIDFNLYQLVVDYFYEMIKDNKNSVIVVIFLVY